MKLLLSALLKSVSTDVLIKILILLFEKRVKESKNVLDDALLCALKKLNDGECK